MRRRKMTTKKKSSVAADIFMPLPAREIITGLGNDNQPLLHTRLVGLSNLSPQDSQFFSGVWPGIDPGRRCQIVYRLLELAENNIELNFDGIFKMCLGDGNDDVRSKAIEGLWENEEPSLAETLVTMLEKDASEKVQVAAAAALGKFAILTENGNLRTDYKSRIEESLLAVIADKKRLLSVRSRALEAVAPFSIPGVKAAILEAYQSREPELKVSAVYAMGRNCDAGWLPLLLSELGSSDAELRYEAAGACAELEAEEAVFLLIRLVDDDDADVQMAAVRALGKIGNAEAKEYLERCLDSDSQLIREAVAEAMQLLKAENDGLFS